MKVEIFEKNATRVTATQHSMGFWMVDVSVRTISGWYKATGKTRTYNTYEKAIIAINKTLGI